MTSPALSSATPAQAGGRTYPIDRAATASFLLFAAGAIAGLFQLFYPFDPGGQRNVEFGDGFEMVAIARNLAAQGTFANPFLVENTGPTAVEPPLYPLFLAALTTILKNSTLVAMVALVCNVAANALVASWLPRISLLFFGEIAPGIVAAVLWLAAARLMPSWDASYTVAGLVFFCLFTATSIERTANLSGFGALAGLIAGLLILLNPASVIVSAAWIAYLLIRRRTPLAKAARYCCGLAASLFLIISPWIVRNYREFGAPVLRTNLGMTLYASNNDCAQSSLIETGRNGCYQLYHPNASVGEARLLRALGEVAYDRGRVADTKSWIVANPTRFMRLTLSRFWEFWFPIKEDRAYMTYIIWLATALSVPGLIVMARRREPVTFFVAAVLLIYPFVYYFVVTGVRYRYPVLWLSLLPVGYLAQRAMKRLAW